MINTKPNLDVRHLHCQIEATLILLYKTAVAPAKADKVCPNLNADCFKYLEPSCIS